MTSKDEAVDGRHERRAAGLSELVELVADRAIVLVGDEDEAWDIPLEMLPPKVEVGTFLLVNMEDGRPEFVRLHADFEEVARKGMQTRLARLARYEHLTGTEV